ncbi:16S rRNA (guanine(966)-N(2))-methyltransferase RsmD [Catellatospora sp. NPDC049111]|uniref:16S rRNA (guanine(966)-N(2))-methyltransferase RsmD n=1 Tax=Catellatospora sp. NPDC049111 TaxID=3155271 RepID=UPI0033E83C09
MSRPRPCRSVVIVTRIVAGRYGGRRLHAPTGRDTRPTSDRVREALFSALEAMTDLSGARVLDLFAGSGAVGLEALSRGASHVLLVESDAKAVRVIRENIATLGAGAAARVAAGKAATVLAGGPADGAYDVVFADPPYALSEEDLAAVLSGLAGNGWLAEDTVLVVERSSRSPEPAWVQGITGERSRRYGETALWYGRAVAQSGGAVLPEG